MKKFFALIASFLAVFACCFAVACKDKGPDKADENTVVITASESSFDFNGKTLKAYMDDLQDKGKLTYTISNGMVTAINGKSQTLNSYWMLYTSDTDNASTEWGTFEYEDNLYGSATCGVDLLVVKEGCIYIWAYQTF